MSTKIGMSSLGSAKNVVDAETMLGSVCQRATDLHSRLRYASVSADSRAFGLRKDRGGLQSSLHFLRYPADARQTPQPNDGIGPGRNPFTGRRRGARI